MSIRRFQGTCPYCGHDHDADQSEFHQMMKELDAPRSERLAQMHPPEGYAAPQEKGGSIRSTPPGSRHGEAPAVAAPQSTIAPITGEITGNRANTSKLDRESNEP